MMWLATLAHCQRRHRTFARCVPETSRGIFMRRTKFRRGPGGAEPARAGAGRRRTPSWPQARSRATAATYPLQFEAATIAGDEIPGGPFGDGFRFYIGGQIAIQDRPVGFVERRLLRRMTIVDCPARGGQHHTLDGGIASRAQDPQSAFPRRHDQVVLVFWGIGGNGGRDVHDIVTSRRSFPPPRIAHQIGGKK